MYLQALLSQALRDARPSARSRELDPLLLRDGGAVARDRAGARLRDSRRGEDAKKPFVEVSGRKGLGVKIDDLLDLLTDKAIGRSRQAQPGVLGRRMPARRPRRSPSAAIRYFMLKFSRGKLIVFDIEEALSFEGETGPYLQYAVVRANNIFQKLHEREGLSEADVLGALDGPPPDELSTSDESDGDARSGRWSSRPHVSTTSSNRSCGRSSSRRWRSTPSGSPSCSTRSTISTRF